MLWVAEHGWITKGRRSVCSEDGNLELCSEDFDALLSLLDENDDNDMGPVFSFTRRNGTDCLKVQNWVGLIRTSGGTQIEVLPKLSRADGPQSCRKLLVKMLIHLEDAPFREAPLASLEAHDMPLLELLLRYFLQQVALLVKRGVARTYVEYEDDLVYLRGKLALAEHVRRNSARGGRLYCQYDEYQTNRPVNRIVRGALDVTKSLTRDSDNQRLCNELLYYFDEVPPTTDVALDQRQMQRDRVVRHYKKSLPPALMILERLNPLTLRGPREVLSMLFPMERVFEDYVAAMLRTSMPGWRISTQVRGKHLVQGHQGSAMFGLRPDLRLQNNDKLIIADTKWKLLDAADRRHNYGITQADIYQMFAYSRRWLDRQPGLKEVILIYPKSGNFAGALETFWYEVGDALLKVLPFDLEKERLVGAGIVAG